MQFKQVDPLSNHDILEKTKDMQIFRGVFMRDTLPTKAKNIEAGILNLDSSDHNGTHWVLWYKNGKQCFYFDSFGHRPPVELKAYLNNDIIFSEFQLQEIGTKYCGHLCLQVLQEIIINKRKPAVVAYNKAITSLM